MKATIVARAQFFSHHGLETLESRIDDDGTVCVWDDVAHHYTVCHALSEHDQWCIRAAAIDAGRVRALSAEAAEAGDLAMCALCDSALQGSKEGWAACSAALAR